MIRTVSDSNHWTMKGKKYLPFLDALWCKQAHLKAVPLPALVTETWIGVHACGSEKQFNISPAGLFCLPARWIHSQFSSTLPFCRVKDSSHSDYLYKASTTVWITVETFWAPEHPSYVFASPEINNPELPDSLCKSLSWQRHSRHDQSTWSE